MTTEKAPSLEYLAGFFDGDGCICIYKQRNPNMARGHSYRLYISVTQKAPLILEVFKAQWGGSIHDRSKYANIWMAYGQSALKALKELAPHLILKREEALLAISFQTEKTERKNRRCTRLTESEFASDEAACLKMRGLKDGRR